MYAEVIIPLALPRNYTWAVPPEWQSRARIGVRAEVVLGRQKKYAGVICRLTSEKPEAFDPKPLLSILDAEPIVTELQLKFWQWLADYYLCTEGEVMSAALPTAFKLSSETILLWNEAFGDDFRELDEEEYLVAEALQIRKELRIQEVQQLLDLVHVYPVVKRLLEKKVCLVWEELKESYAPRLQSYVSLEPAFENEQALEQLLNSWSRAPKQLDLLLAFLHLRRQQGDVTRSELLLKSGASDAQLKGLVEKEVLRVEKRAVDRIPVLAREIRLDSVLSDMQQRAVELIRSEFQEKPVVLLHGVTSSGKTQVYIELIASAIREGKQVLYLLPEIALTSQIIRRLQHHFGGYVGIYHSKFSNNERVEIWNKVRNGEIRVLLGARSALFLPFVQLGLIIVDEEHESSFKQADPAPRYQARDAAILLASLCEARTLLGSATPSLESYHHALQGKYGLVELTERYGGVQHPDIQLVDLRVAKTNGSDAGIITPALQQAIEKTLQEQQQVILFQNRRGYTPYQVCKTCGWIPHCRHCDVSLTYHKQSNQLHCHYCGTRYALVSTCQACGSHDFLKRSFGTEKIEEELGVLFPQARIARMDIDSVRGKTAHEQLIRQFEQHKVDILVGTQMVVKGLDFEKVKLVGILDADSILNFSDFRVNERAFQLMEQVSGRAGRKGEAGRVMIQVYQVKHPVLHFVQQHDYRAFYEFEIQGRRQFFYPPFSRVLRLTIRHAKKEVAEEAAAFLAEQLRVPFGSYMSGPAEPVINRVRNQYRMEILLKLPAQRDVLRQCRQLLHSASVWMHQHADFKRVQVMADMDPI